jgi:hypothetical protein
MADKTADGLDRRQTLNCMLDDDQSAGPEPISGTASALAWSAGIKHNEYQDSRIMNTAELSARAPLRQAGVEVPC